MKGLMMSIAGLVFILCRVDSGMSQGLLTIKPKNPIICYQGFDNRHDHVGVSERFQALRNGAAARTKTATIVVEYISFPADAKQAFQFAVEILETELISSVPIRIQADWRPLGTGVLGQAIWGSAHANFGGEQHMNVFYPVALAEKIAGREINDASEPDVLASFNSTSSWYFGTDGKTPSGKMDMVTIVLHEIAHGLGFTDTYNVRGAQGSVGLDNEGTLVPFVFDLFVENLSDKNLIQDFQSPSEALGTELQSANLFFDSPTAKAALNGVRPKLYAPKTFDNGSSISHLDESTFNNDQDANRLMTPHISPAESIHNLGSVLLATLSDMGWIHTAIDHVPLKDSERKDGQPYAVTARIRSDQGYDPTSVKLHYTTNGVNFVEVNMDPTGSADEFKYSLPGTTSDLTYAYYISVNDVRARTFTSPGKMYEVGADPQQSMHYFRVGPDVEAPQILHNPVRFVAEADNLVLEAEVTDNQGLSEVIVEYRINDGSILTAVMEEGMSASDFTVTVDLPAVTSDDEIRYRLIARDVAAVENITFNPSNDFYLVDVTGIMPVRDSYTNTFDRPSTDFFGDNFSIITPQGFRNGAIHTNHPYGNGAGPNSESNFTYQLQIPIRIKAENPVIRFDEIVLVEPGEDNSVFGGDGFYDYVIVEGSVDGGASWKPFAPGYNARADNAWFMRYESDISGDNSLAKGDSTLFRQRVINMLEDGVFSEGNEVLVRFRLFADQLAHGWGWAIDNLEIQPTVTALEEPPGNLLDVYPVPASDELFVDIRDGNSAPVTIEITDAVGRIVYSQVVTGPSEEIHIFINVREFENGLYILRARSDLFTHIRKFLKAAK